MRPDDNNFYIDGANDNDIYYGETVVNDAGISGTPASHLPLDSIQRGQGAPFVVGERVPGQHLEVRVNGLRVESTMVTAPGTIRVRIPAGVGYNLSARTSFGRVSSELPVTATGNIGGDTLNGTIGSGGCQLQLNDSNGSIEITKAP
jgi:hypothetical protein